MEAKKTPIPQTMIQRVIQGTKYIVAGITPDGWFTPQQPIEPVAQEQAAGRQFDYATGWNIRVTNTKVHEGVSHKQLRALADGYDLMRLVIETRKDQVAALKWEIKYKEKDKKSDTAVDEIKAFFEFPDLEHTHEIWLRAIMEDLLVIDAPCVYPRKTKGGSMFSIDLMDGATINKLLDVSGRTPMPPSPAYQQIIKELPAVDYTFDELVYMPRNVRTYKVYGFSPVEQVIMTVTIALRRQIGQINYYTEGNIPEALASVPESWSLDQLKQYQAYWDAIIEGNQAQKRKLKFIPNGLNYIPTKEPELKNEFDEWLARVICFAFSVSPQALSAMMNRATAETAKNSADSEGLEPLKNWIKGFHDYIIRKYFGRSDIEFAWKDTTEPDAKTKAEIHQIYVNSRIKKINEVRAELGLEALSDEELQPEDANAPQNTPNKGEAKVNAAEGVKKPSETKSNPKEAGKPKVGKSERVTAGKIEASTIEKAGKTGTPIDRNRKEVTDRIESLQDVLTKQLYSFGKTVSGNIGKEWDKQILNRWQKGDYDRVYINGLKDGKAYFEEVSGRLHLKAFINEGASREALDLQVAKQLEKAFGEYWQEVFYPQEGAINTIAYADIVKKSFGVNDYLNKIDDVDFNLLIKKVNPYAEEMYQGGISAGFESIAYNPEYAMLNILNERAGEWAATRGLELAKLSESTKNFLRPVIESAIENGHNVGTLKKELVDSYGFSPYRAEMIARTEMAFADSQGNYDAWEASGLVKYKRSVLGTNENHGDDDIANAAQGIIEFKQEFQSGHQCPPYHPHCMCALQPIMEKGED